MVIGTFTLVFFFGNTHKERLEQIQLYVYMNHHANKNDVLKLQKILESKPYIIGRDGVNYISKEAATKAFLESNEDANISKEDIINTAGFDPITERFEITLQKSFSSSEQLEKIKGDLEQYLSVKEVDLTLERKDKIQLLRKNLQIIKLFLLGVILLSVSVVILLINNTIKLAMFSQRFLIRSMQLVGAKPSFIRRPFIAKSFAHGLIAGIVSSSLILGSIIYFSEHISFLKELMDYNLLSLVFIGLALFGALLCSLSTYISVNRYLKLSLDDLY